MIWHLLVLGVPPGFISGPVPSGLLESALLSQRQEPAKDSLFDLFLGIIQPLGKLVGGRICYKFLSWVFPEKDRHSFHFTMCFNLQSNSRLKCFIEGKRRRGFVFILYMKKSNPWETEVLSCPWLLSYCVAKGNLQTQCFFLVPVCSWRPTRLLLIEHRAGYLQVRQVIQTSLYLCKAGAIIPILQVSKLSFREFKHLSNVTQTGKRQSLHLNTSLLVLNPMSFLCHLSGHGKTNL